MTIKPQIIAATNHELLIATDKPDPQAGNACHHYEIKGNTDPEQLCSISFQHGPISETGVNGASDLMIAKILLHRLESFQTSAYACVENDKALQSLKEFIQWTNARTASRKKRAVEGTSKI